jgi:glycosyltransferase involved in cell wall biosynthesis
LHRAIDGSSDETVEICMEHGVEVALHPYSRGNGAAIKTRARASIGYLIVFLDGDGQHKPEDIPRLLAEMEKGSDMVAGARGRESQADSFRFVANGFFYPTTCIMAFFRAGYSVGYIPIQTERHLGIVT